MWLIEVSVLGRTFTHEVRARRVGLPSVARTVPTRLVHFFDRRAAA